MGCVHKDYSVHAGTLEVGMRWSGKHNKLGPSKVGAVVVGAGLQCDLRQKVKVKPVSPEGQPIEGSGKEKQRPKQTLKKSILHMYSFIFFRLRGRICTLYIRCYRCAGIYHIIACVPFTQTHKTISMHVCVYTYMQQWPRCVSGGVQASSQWHQSG